MHRASRAVKRLVPGNDRHSSRSPIADVVSPTSRGGAKRRTPLGTTDANRQRLLPGQRCRAHCRQEPEQIVPSSPATTIEAVRDVSFGVRRGRIPLPCWAIGFRKSTILNMIANSGEAEQRPDFLIDGKPGHCRQGDTRCRLCIPARYVFPGGSVPTISVMGCCVFAVREKSAAFVRSGCGGCRFSNGHPQRLAVYTNVRSQGPARVGTHCRGRSRPVDRPCSRSHEVPVLAESGTPASSNP